MNTDERISVHNLTAIMNAIRCLETVIPREGCGFTEEELDTFIHTTLLERAVMLQHKVRENSELDS